VAKSEKSSQRISGYFRLTGSQGALDFVDVYVGRDIPLFIDPTVLATVNSEWANECASAVQTFFQTVIDLMRAGDEAQALSLLTFLGEDNSTRLGYSSRGKGSGVGAGLAAAFYDELSTSKAVKSGLITDLEDTALFIEGVREDRVSDVVTNIIRKQLIEYTQATAKYYGMPLTKNIATRSCWNNHSRRWDEPRHSDLPLVPNGPLLLVPKSIVRRTLYYDPGEYYTHYVLPFFQAQEIANRSSLVHFLRSGVPKVYKKDVDSQQKAKHNPENPGVEKRVSLDATDQNSEILERFKRDKAASPPGALSHEDIAKNTQTSEPDFDALLQGVLDIQAGRDSAWMYEHVVEALLTALLYPSLVNPVRQLNLHGGRKRIDIAYNNMAADGFFKWLSNHYPSGQIFIECKNYSRSLANEEFDQIAGRFSPSRGKYGLLVYRAYSDKEKVLASLRDTAQDDRGYVTALDDTDLSALVEEVKTTGTATGSKGLLESRFKALIN